MQDSGSFELTNLEIMVLIFLIFNQIESLELNEIRYHVKIGKKLHRNLSLKTNFHKLEEVV